MDSSKTEVSFWCESDEEQLILNPQLPMIEADIVPGMVSHEGQSLSSSVQAGPHQPPQNPIVVWAEYAFPSRKNKDMHASLERGVAVCYECLAPDVCNAFPAVDVCCVHEGQDAIHATGFFHDSEEGVHRDDDMTVVSIQDKKLNSDESQRSPSEFSDFLSQQQTIIQHRKLRQAAIQFHTVLPNSLPQQKSNIQHIQILPTPSFSQSSLLAAYKISDLQFSPDWFDKFIEGVDLADGDDSADQVDAWLVNFMHEYGDNSLDDAMEDIKPDSVCEDDVAHDPLANSVNLWLHSLKFFAFWHSTTVEDIPAPEFPYKQKISDANSRDKFLISFHLGLLYHHGMQDVLISQWFYRFILYEEEWMHFYLMRLLPWRVAKKKASAFSSGVPVASPDLLYKSSAGCAGVNPTKSVLSPMSKSNVLLVGV